MGVCWFIARFAVTMSGLSNIPSELFGYKVVDKVGEGAASVVYAVFDPKTKQVMALKHVHRRTEKDQRYIDQIEAEYKIGSKLKHENIRGITEFMQNKRFPWSAPTDAALLMELIDAETLDSAPRPSGECVARYFAQAAMALAHMHEVGFVHADMKPSNMMISKDGSVKIIDLGQACAVDTVKARVQGTPGYIAPEQAFREAVTPQTDVYNFGATLYWVLLRNEIPCSIPSHRGKMPPALTASQLRLPRAVHEQDARIPPAFNDVVMECIQPLMHKRTQLMETVAMRLEEIAEHCRKTGAGRSMEGLTSANNAPDTPVGSEPSKV